MERTTRSPYLLPILFAPIFMVLLDVFIVNVAAPSLQSQLGASESQIQWIVAAYLLSYAMSLITGGRLGDLFGRRRLFLVGVTGFTVASALCAAAPSATALIAARVLQGFGAAAMWPQVLSIIQVEMDASERPRAFGIQGMVQGAASITGQIVGGALIGLDLFGLGWRWVFLVNIPIGLLALASAGRVVPESRAPAAGRLDLKGVGLATMALLLILFPAVEGREQGWPAWVFVALAAAPLAGIAFVWVERRVARGGGTPLVNIDLFSNVTFRRGLMASVCQLSLTSFFLVFSIYMQEGAGLDAIGSGLAFTPMAAAFVGASLAGARTTGRVRAALPQAGALLAAVGLVLTIGVVVTDPTPAASPWLILATIPFGAGQGFAIPAMIAMVLGSVPVEQAGTGSGVVSTSQQIGNSMGIAVGGTVFFQVLGSHPAGLDFGHALAVTSGVQAVNAVVAAVLFTRARVRERAQVSAAASPAASR